MLPLYDVQVKQQAEPFEHDIPIKPWYSLTLDNFEYKGNFYLIIYDRLIRFFVVKDCADFRAHSAIIFLLEVFCEHGVLSNICSDRGRNFVSKEFDTFCKDLGIVSNFSSGYHDSANQVECAVRTVKDLMKRCDNAGVHWRIALLKFLCTPGPNGKSPSSLMGRQFCGILPMMTKLQIIYTLISFQIGKTRRKKEKFDTKHSIVDSTMSYLNSDLKTWNVGVVVAHSSDNRSYHVRTESSTVISHNRVHLRPTNVNFALQQPVYQNFPEKVSSAVEKIAS